MQQQHYPIQTSQGSPMYGASSLASAGSLFYMSQSSGSPGMAYYPHWQWPQGPSPPQAAPFMQSHASSSGTALAVMQHMCMPICQLLPCISCSCNTSCHAAALCKAVSLTVPHASLLLCHMRVYQVQYSVSMQPTANPFSNTNSQRREETEHSLSNFPI